MTFAARRLLVLSGYAAIGGPLPKITPLLVDGFRGAGFQVEELGWSAHSAGHEPLPVKLAGRIADLVRVVRRVRSWRPGAVYVATTLNWPSVLRDLPLALALALLGSPLVLHLHGSESRRLVLPGDEAFTRATRLLVDRVAALFVLSTEEAADWLRFAPRTPQRLVTNPFVPAGRRSHPGRPHDPFTFLCVARLTPEKGLYELLDAFAGVSRTAHCRLVIAGRGPERHGLQRRAAALGVAETVELPGYLSGADLDTVYRAADAFVLPSYLEGFPLTVMEAMGYALPIVTTRIRGCADHLEEGVNALFVQPRDSVALAAALEQLRTAEPLRQAMGEANAVKVDEFAPEKVVPAYVEVLTAVMTRAAA